MKKFLFATHGTLAAGAKSTLELLIGNVADITCLTAYVNPDDNVDEQLKAYFSEVSDEDQVIVCTDLMGGSVNQKIVPYAQKKNVFLIAGFNLPLLLAGICIKLLFFAGKGLAAEYARGIAAGIRGARGLRRVSFCKAHFGNYVKIQFDLWINIFRVVFLK